MLQWMGGSRRKVTTSRRSTLKRQKHYFEQRKRQLQPQQATVPGCHEGEISMGNPSHKKHRSLDILCLQNLSTAQDCKPGCSNDHQNTKHSPYFLDKATPASSGGFDDPENSLECRVETASPKEVMCNAPLDQNIESKAPGVNSKHLKTAEQYASVLDLLGDDGSNDEFGYFPTYEAHVAFSVEGLGKVATKTPVNSPPQHFNCSLPLNPAKPTYASSNHDFSFDGIDLGVAAEAYNVNSSPGFRSLKSPLYSNCNMDSIINPDQTPFTSNDRLQLSCGGGKGRSLFCDLSCDEKNDNICNDSFGFLDENFLYEMERDKPWRNWPCLMDDDSSGFLECKDYPMSDFARRSPRRLKRREAEAAMNSFNILDSTSYHGDGRSKNNCISIASDVPRCPTMDKWGNFHDANNQQTWSHFMDEDTKDNLSLPSEESCSSSAVMAEGAIDSSPNPIERQSVRRHADHLREPAHKCGAGNLYLRERGCSILNVNPKESNFEGLGKQMKMSKATHNPSLISLKQGKHGSQNLERTSSGQAADFTVPKLPIHSSQHSTPVKLFYYGHHSSGKFAFQQPYCHAQPSDSLPDLSVGPELDGTPPYSSIVAVSHGDSDFLDSTVQESVEDGKTIIVLDSNDMSDKCKGTAADVLNKFGKDEDEKECMNKELSCDAQMPFPCQDGRTETANPEHGKRAIVSNVQENPRESNRSVTMLQSYVLQFLCVQNVLTETSARNALEKA